MSNVYRPWGPLQWLIPKLGGRTWSVLGVLGTEDRCSAVITELQGNLNRCRFLKIIDPHMSPAAAFESRFKEIEARLIAAGVAAENIRTVDLLQDIDTMQEELAAFLATSGPNVVLDITSMPKWWFFPLVRFLASAAIESLIVTYALAEKYADQLSSDPAPLRPLPTFDEPRLSDHYDELVVSVGYAPLGLKDMLEGDIDKIRYLFPFPPGPPHFFRNWHFLRTLETEVQNLNLSIEDRWQVSMHDVSNTFDALCNITKRGERTSALAPYGPKTTSLAMCLFALAAAKSAKEPVHVLYTQPKRYALDYSSGIKRTNGVAEIKAYCLRLVGRDLYTF